MGVDGGAADERLGEVEFDVVLGADLLKHFLRHLHDLGADAVAGKEGDVVVFGRRRAPCDHGREPRGGGRAS